MSKKIITRRPRRRLLSLAISESRYAKYERARMLRALEQVKVQND